MGKVFRTYISLLVIACMTMLSAMPVYAASKGIKNVSIKIEQSESGFGVGSEAEEENINVSVKGSDAAKYSVTKYEFSEEVDGIIGDEAPTLEVTLTAADGYRFGVMTGKNMKFTGDLKPEYVGSKRENSNKDLVVKVKLNGIHDNAANVDYAEWDYSRPGVIKNYSMSDVNYYEVRLRNDTVGKVYSAIIPAGVKEFDLSQYMRSVGDYSFMIREISSTSGRKGEWYECEEDIKIDEATVALINQKYAYASLDGNGWQKDDKGWWFKYPGGSYPASQWLKDNGHDFYFNAEGYMVTGWNEIDGAWYYMNESGEKQFNCVTPDGHTLDEEGKRIDW